LVAQGKDWDLWTRSAGLTDAIGSDFTGAILE
jgi:hypothetical protein